MWRCHHNQCLGTLCFLFNTTRSPILSFLAPICLFFLLYSLVVFFLPPFIYILHHSSIPFLLHECLSPFLSPFLPSFLPPFPPFLHSPKYKGSVPPCGRAENTRWDLYYQWPNQDWEHIAKYDLYLCILILLGMWLYVQIGYGMPL